MKSFIAIAVMAVILSAILWGSQKLQDRLKQTFSSWKHAAIMAGGLIFSLVVGLLLLSTAFHSKQSKRSERTPTKSKSHRPMYRAVFFTHHKDVTKDALTKCKPTEITIIRGKKIICRPFVRGRWKPRRRKAPKVMQQSFLGWFAPAPMSGMDGLPTSPPPATVKPAAKKEDPKKKHPWLYKYPELFYFGFIVLGVLAKWFVDRLNVPKGVEAPNQGPKHLVYGIIVGALVFATLIQQGSVKNLAALPFVDIKKELVIAFYNGFFFQAILNRPSVNPGATTPPNSAATEPSANPPKEPPAETTAPVA